MTDRLLRRLRHPQLGMCCMSLGLGCSCGAGAASDPNFASVVLLMGFEGADGSTTFTDESSFAHVMTAQTNAQIDTAQFKFGASSYLGTATADFITTPDSADFEMGAGQFTAECFARWSDLSLDSGLIGKQSSSTTGPAWALIRFSTGVLTARIASTTTGGTFIDTSASPSLNANQWYHIACDRDASNKVRLYLDGAMIASGTVATNIPDTTGTMRVGGAATGGTNRTMHGWLDEVRVTKGVARYASDSGFTVPTAAFPRS